MAPARSNRRLPFALGATLSLLGAGPLPAQIQVHSWDGSVADQEFGRRVSGVADVNGDGRAEIAVGSTTPVTFQGEVRLFSGADGSLLASWQGLSAGDGFGISVGDAGDMNADGYPDVIVGAPLVDGPAGTDAGAAYVYSGRFIATGAPPELLYQWDGHDPGGRFGWEVSGAGDVSGDGRADVIVAEPWAVAGTLRGQVCVYEGAAGRLLYCKVGDTNGSNFGGAIDGIGDLDQDGHADIMVGAWDDSTVGTTAGMVRVFDGRRGNVLATLYGDGPLDRFGHSVSGAGDVNQDGWPDLLISALDGGYVRVYSGRWVMQGAGVAVLHEWLTPLPGSLFGWEVDGGEDVDGDGIPDVVIGAYLDTHAGKIQNGSVSVYSGATGALMFLEQGDDAHDHFGQSVRLAGDVDGDGRADVVMGAPGDDNTASGSGMARVVKRHSCPAGWSNYGSGWPGFVGVPSLTVSGDPVLGAHLTLDASSSLGLATVPGSICVGFTPAVLPTGFGGDLLLIPSLVLALPVPGAGLSLPLDVPDDANLCGVKAYLQMLQADPIAAGGVSFTRGLELRIGY